MSGVNSATKVFASGNYRYIPSVFQYSGGVAAMPGYEIVRETFAQPVPLVDGFDLIASRLAARGLGLQSFCACELRSPDQFTDAGFLEFNSMYVEKLRHWAIVDDQFVNPVARSNVCPDSRAPQTPSFHAFSYVVPSGSHAGGVTAVISGSGEAAEPNSPDELYRDRIIRFGDTSDAGMQDKVQYVLSEMERRLGLLGFDWAATTNVQVYSVCNFHSSIADIVGRGAAGKGLNWHYARPPVMGLEFEMDCRIVHQELTCLR